MKNRDESRQKIIQNIKDCGQSIIDNAEKILTSYEYNVGDITIICNNLEGRDSAPTIEVSQSFYPENIINRLM